MGDKFQVKLIGAYIGQPTVNIWWYENTTGTGTAPDFAAAWNTALMTLLSHFTNENAFWSKIEVNNFDNPTDFTILTPSPNEGVQTSEALPPFVCWTFEYRRATRAVRNGFKRIAGVSEGNTSSGTPTAGVVADLNAYATALHANVVGASGAVYVPRIARVTYPVPNPLHLPPTSVTLFPVASVVYSKIGSQNSRKF